MQKLEQHCESAVQAVPAGEHPSTLADDWQLTALP